jgi:hypothetical protein
MAVMFLENPFADFNVLNAMEQAKVGMTFVYDGRKMNLKAALNKN